MTVVVGLLIQPNHSRNTLYCHDLDLTLGLHSTSPDSSMSSSHLHQRLRVTSSDWTPHLQLRKGHNKGAINRVEGCWLSQPPHTKLNVNSEPMTNTSWIKVSTILKKNKSHLDYKDILIGGTFSHTKYWFIKHLVNHRTVQVLKT